MQRLLIALVFSLSLTVHAGAQTRTDWEDAGLKGRVKSIRVEQAEFVGLEGTTVAKARHVTSEATYDSQGSLLEEWSYKPDGTLRGRKTFARDADGHKTVTSYSAAGVLLGSAVYTYDEAGHITGTASYNARGALIGRSVSIYDARGRFAGGMTYNADGSLDTRTVVTFDAEKQRAERAYYDAAGKLLGKDSLTDAGGYAIHNKPDGTVWSKDVYQTNVKELDAQGNWIKRTWHKSVTQEDKTEDRIEVLYRTITYY